MSPFSTAEELSLARAAPVEEIAEPVPQITEDAEFVLLPHTMVVPQTTELPDITVVPQTSEVPHTTLVPQTTLVPVRILTVLVAVSK